MDGGIQRPKTQEKAECEHKSKDKKKNYLCPLPWLPSVSLYFSFFFSFFNFPEEANIDTLASFDVGLIYT